MSEPVFALPAAAGYSQVVTIAPGRLVWTAGQIGTAADGRVGHGWEEQARLAFQNVERALGAAGAAMRDVVKLTFFVVSTEGLEIVRAVRDEFVDVTRPPTSSLVVVAGLVRPELLIEVEAVASLPA